MDNNDCVYFHGGTGRIQEGFQCASITVQALTKLNKKIKNHDAADYRPVLSPGSHNRRLAHRATFPITDIVEPVLPESRRSILYVLIILFILDLYRLYQFLALSSLLSSIYLKIQKVSKVLPFSVQVGAHLTGI